MFQLIDNDGNLTISIAQTTWKELFAQPDRAASDFSDSLIGVTDVYRIFCGILEKTVSLRCDEFLDEEILI